MTGLLLNTTLDHQQIEFAQIVRASGQNLLSLITRPSELRLTNIFKFPRNLPCSELHPVKMKLA